MRTLYPQMHLTKALSLDLAGQSSIPAFVQSGALLSIPECPLYHFIIFIPSEELIVFKLPSTPYLVTVRQLNPSAQMDNPEEGLEAGVERFKLTGGA